LQAVLAFTLTDLLGRVRTDRHELHTAAFELRAKFLPSPQLGDTIRSPVSAEELEKRGAARNAGDIEHFPILVGRREGRKRGTNGYCRSLRRLRRQEVA